MSTPPKQMGKEVIQYGIQIWKPVLALIIFTLAIGAIGEAVFQRYKDSIKNAKLHELGSIAEAKKNEVMLWMNDRSGDAQSITQASFFLDEVEHWLQRGGTAGESRAKLLERLDLLKQAYAGQGYTQITLFDSNAVPRLSTLAEAPLLHEGIQDGLLKCMRSGQIVFSDIHPRTQNAVEGVEIEVMAPLMAGEGEKAHAIGAILFSIDPRYFLFPLIQKWPVSGTSVENLIVRRENDEAVYINDLRHLNSTSLFLRLPLSRQQLLATKALSGQEGVVEGEDYRGVPVVGVLNKIPNTSWYMISKIDRAEIYAPINKLAMWAVALSLFFFCAGCGVFAYWWKKQRQSIRLLQAQHDSEKKYHRLFELAQEGIWVIDADSITSMVNPAMVNMLGYTQEEMLGRHLFDFLDEQGRRLYEQSLERLRQGFQAQHDFEFIRKDGARIFTAIAAAPIMDSQGVYKGAVAGVMNITERKQSEMRLAESYKELQQLSSHLDSVREEERNRIARELHDEMGATLAALKMRVAWLASRLPSGLTELSDETAHISGLVSDGIRTVREIVTKLRPDMLDELGFAAAVEDSVKKLRLQTGVECNFVLSIDEGALNAEQSAMLFRIIQEALTNVAKHAQASRVEISLVERENSLLLIVEDNGVGFGEEVRRNSYGLIGIRERAQMMDGTATITSAPDTGTRVTVTIPVAASMSGNAHPDNS